MNVNQVNLVGRVTKEPELKALPAGTKVCKLSIATNRTWKDKDGVKKENTDFHNVVAFGKTAEIMAQYITKGQLLYVMGRLQTQSWEHATHKINMYRTEVIVESFQFGPKAGAGKPAAPAKEESSDGVDWPEEEVNPDDIPF